MSFYSKLYQLSLMFFLFSASSISFSSDCSVIPSNNDEKLIWMDNCVKLNQVQTISAHNAYHQNLKEKLENMYFFGPTTTPNGTYLPLGILQEIFNRDTNGADGFPPTTALNFGLNSVNHESLTNLLDLGVRNLQIDVNADTEGGRYANPIGLQLLSSLNPGKGIPKLNPGQMNKPGFKVMHIPDEQWATNCTTFKNCLSEIKSWSDNHLNHFPIVVLVEVKQGRTYAAFPNSHIDTVLASLGYNVTPTVGFENMDENKFMALDDEISSIFPDSQLIVPDLVRKNYGSLKQAIDAEGWPNIGSLRGKVMFLLFGGRAADGRTVNTIYLSAFPKLENAKMFLEGGAAPVNEHEVILFNSDPVPPARFTAIRNFVLQKYIVASRADANTVEGRNNDTVKRSRAFDSGAQQIATDFPYPENPFPPSTYRGVFQEGPLFLRCSPASLGGLEGCDSLLLE